jgi:hypothetical protein
VSADLMDLAQSAQHVGALEERLRIVKRLEAQRQIYLDINMHVAVAAIDQAIELVGTVAEEEKK